MDPGSSIGSFRLSYSNVSKISSLGIFHLKHLLDLESSTLAYLGLKARYYQTLQMWFPIQGCLVRLFCYLWQRHFDEDQKFCSFWQSQNVGLWQATHSEGDVFCKHTTLWWWVMPINVCVDLIIHNIFFYILLTFILLLGIILSYCCCNSRSNRNVAVFICVFRCFIASSVDGAFFLEIKCRFFRIINCNVAKD